MTPVAAPVAAPDARPDTLPGCVRARARATPDRVALREKRLGLWQEVTWATYWDRVVAVALELDARGVGPGDAVAILSDNRPEWLYADLATQLLGARAVGIYQTNPPEDVAYILAHSRAKLLIAEDQEQVDKAVDVAADTPDLATVVVIDPRGTRHYDDERLCSWDDLLAAGQARLRDVGHAWADARLDALDPAAPTMVVYTSGTTGPPKGALLSARNALTVGREILPLMRVDERDTLLSYLPLCHVAEKIFTLFLPLTAGAVVHFGESIATVRDDLREVAPTIFLGVPRIWEKMHATATLKMKDASWLKRTLYTRLLPGRAAIARRRRERGRLGLGDRLVWALGDLLIFRALRLRLGLTRCRLPVSGAAPISADLLAWFHAIGVRVVEGYGQTECAGVSHLNLPGAFKLGTVGRAVPGVEERFADDGEILVRGPSVFCGYLHDPESTAATVDADGWLHTGDVGARDADGFVTITGRKKEILITAGGKNISPEKIENALKLSPYIKESVAIGDARAFVSALVQIDYDTVGDWASRRGIPYGDYTDLAHKPEVTALISEAINDANTHLAQVESVRAFRVLPRELNQDEGELTATQKVRRREVMTRYDGLIRAIYGDDRRARAPEVTA